MPITTDKNLISSKDLLEKTGISRATLNNYIKVGIIPRPIVLGPSKGMRKVSRIGYFPRAAVERVEIVKVLKREGHSMQDIAKRFRNLPETQPLDRITEVSGEQPELTLEDISSPAYLINYNFEIEWINREAELTLFAQQLRLVRDLQSRNIFKVLFNWEFHNHVQNWEDLLGFHMSFAKSRLSRAWIEQLFTGISETQSSLLKQIYDGVPTFSQQGPKFTNIELSLADGTTHPYSVHTMFFKEGILFVYASAGSERLSFEPVGLFIRSGMNISSIRESQGFSSNSKAPGKGVTEQKALRGPTNENGGGENGFE
ncbi:MAG: MerR family transcriptional regulator [Desulfobacteraceae bacterium]|jgi:DNA-binding transcriptional MerR regulator